jgi:hypothetical protein
MTPTPSAADLKKILATLDPYQASQLQWVFTAFVDVLDGIQAHDLPGITGLEQATCNVISDIRNEVAKAI